MDNAVTFSVCGGRKFLVKLGEQSEYNEVQSTVLAKGWRYSTLIFIFISPNGSENEQQTTKEI